MRKLGFSNEKYTEMQSKRIRERIDQFGGKLYLEFGGKLFDDYHALSRLAISRKTRFVEISVSHTIWIFSDLSMLLQAMAFT